MPLRTKWQHCKPQQHLAQSPLDPEGLEQALPCTATRRGPEVTASYLETSSFACSTVYRLTEQASPGWLVIITDILRCRNLATHLCTILDLPFRCSMESSVWALDVSACFYNVSSTTLSRS